MINIIENDDTVDTSYTIQTVMDGQVKNEYMLKCKSTIFEKEGTKYYLLFDKYYNLVRPAFKYINIYMSNLNKAEQTKEKTLVALKLLYSFISIFSIDLRTMTHDEVAQMMAFFLGASKIGERYSLSLLSPRSISSVNDYLSIIRGYIKYLDYEDHPLLNKAGKKTLLYISGGIEKEKYEYQLRDYKHVEIPKHIKLDQYKRMLHAVAEKNDLRMKCIIKLMYESGLRSGEVLGLTFEDIKQLDDPETGEDVFVLILRNRKTDKNWQSAKFLMKPRTDDDYKLSGYDKRKYGYDKTYISRSTYELLIEYIDSAHSEAMDKYEERWKKYTVTDSVDPDFEEEQNFYVFINSLGKPLSKKTLDNEMKKLFIECGIPLSNDGGKRDGLCHRLRHGFAMYQITYNHVKIEQLKELMRHRSLESTQVYYTPETSDIIHHKNEISKKNYQLIPDFDINGITFND